MGIDEAVGQTSPEDVDQGVKPEGFVHDHARPAPVAAEQVIEHQQRVALAGVPAEHDHRSLAP